MGAIFSRALAQVVVGVAVGGVLAAALARLVAERVTPGGVALVAAHLLAMVGVCMLACVVPTRRALRIQPTEALRADA